MYKASSTEARRDLPHGVKLIRTSQAILHRSIQSHATVCQACRSFHPTSHVTCPACQSVLLSIEQALLHGLIDSTP